MNELRAGPASFWSSACVIQVCSLVGAALVTEPAVTRVAARSSAPKTGDLPEAVELFVREAAPDQSTVAVAADPLGLRPAVPREGDRKGVERGTHAAGPLVMARSAAATSNLARQASSGVARPRPILSTCEASRCNCS